MTYNHLLSLIGSKRWQDLDDNGKRKASKKEIGKAREAARAVLGSPDYQLPERGAPPDNNDEWGDFADAADDAGSGDEWAEFEDVGQRDVVSAIKQKIPGVGITSGFRTPEYQEDMRRRGYKPARNSAHLEGSALDLTPPAGMSVDELMQKVKAIEPDAYMLWHDGHLHVEFPDWNGAPAMGNARSAGVRNPVVAR